MPANELYDITRSAWKLGPQRNQVKLVFSVFEGVVREVYRPTAWFPAGTTFNYQWEGRSFRRLKRWEFVGVLADEPLQRRYRGKYVGHLFTAGAQNPVQYLNCPGNATSRRHEADGAAGDRHPVALREAAPQLMPGSLEWEAVGLGA
jgi:hypothetical protein